MNLKPFYPLSLLIPYKMDLEIDIDNYYNIANPEMDASDMVNVVVGGKLFILSRQGILRYPGTVLERRVRTVSLSDEVIEFPNECPIIFEYIADFINEGKLIKAENGTNHELINYWGYGDSIYTGNRCAIIIIICVSLVIFVFFLYSIIASFT